MRQLHAPSQRHLPQMRHVREHDGVFVTDNRQMGLCLEAAKSQYKPYSPQWLNSLSDEEKQTVAAGQFGRQMHDSGAAHITWLFWRGPHRIIGAPPIVHNGSAFILDCGAGPFLVTAAHVFSQFLIDKRKARRIALQIGNLAFDLEDRLIDCGADRRVDIATFRITADEITALEKQVVVGSSDVWPAPPNPGEIAFFGGFLGTQRIAVAPNETSFGLYIAMTPVTDLTEHQIRCRFDRRNWVDVRGLGLPLPGFNLGGVSGGPLLTPTYVNNEWTWRLAGVISEAF